MSILCIYIGAMGPPIETLRTILETAPGNWFVRMVLIETLLAENRVEEAHTVLNSVQELPGNLKFLYYAAKTHGILDPEQGIKIFSKVIERDPQYALAYFEQANLFMKLNRVEAAHQSYEMASQIAPQYANPLLTKPAVVEHPSHQGVSVSLPNSIFDNKETFALKRRREVTGETLVSLIVAFIVFILVGVVLFLVKTTIIGPNPPQIIARPIPDSRTELLETQQIIKPIQRNKPVQTPTAISLNLETVRTPADLSLISFDTDSTQIGNGDFGMNFGTSMDIGSGGSTSSVMFFGSKTKGKRFLFVLDASPSMTSKQLGLRNSELKKTLNTLKKAQYHVLLFGGGAHFVDKGWEQDESKGFYAFESPSGPYTFSLIDTGFTLTDPESFVPPQWLDGEEKQVSATLREVRRSQMLYSTDWDNALRIGHMMDPPPEVIYFMSDGEDEMLDIDKIIENNQMNGRPKIICLAMQTDQGAEAFSEIATRSGGKFIIVDKRGDAIDGDDYLLDPSKYDRRL